MTAVHKTAAEKRAEQSALLNARVAAEYAEFVVTYPVRFANALYKYMELRHAGFTVSKLDDETYEFNCEDYAWSTNVLKVTPPTNPDYEYMQSMTSVESYLRDYANEQAEQLRQYNVKQAALQKLSAEERELLGL